MTAVHLALAAMVVLAGAAGCLEEPVAPHAAGPDPGPAPVPRVESGAAADASHGTPWQRACAEAWSAGGHDFQEPPAIDGQPCLLLPTAKGTLRYALLPGVGDGQRTLAAAPLPRPDGAFDWVVLDEATKDLYFVANGSLEPRLIHRAIPAVLPRITGQGMSAVRLADGSIHAVVYDRGGEQAVGGQSGTRIHHVWWRGDGAAELESLPAGSWYDMPVLQGDGARVVAVAADPAKTTFLVSDGGGFVPLELQGLRVWDFVLAEGVIHACASTGPAYVYVKVRAGEAGVPEVEPISPSPFASLGFACPITLTASGPVVAFDLPPLAGGGPDFDDGATVARRTDLGWALSPLGTDFWSSVDLGTVGDRPVFLRITGNGTGTGDWKDGTEAFIPQADPDQPWLKVWGNFGRTQWIVADPDRFLVVAEGWTNPPFEYPGFPEPGGPSLSWATVEIPLPA